MYKIIRPLGEIFLVIGLIGAIVAAIVHGNNTGSTLAGLVILLAGGFSVVLVAALIDGFAQLIDNTDGLLAGSSNTPHHISENNKHAPVKDDRAIVKEKLSDSSVPGETELKIHCRSCGNDLYFTKTYLIENEVLVCPYCGAELQAKLYR